MKRLQSLIIGIVAIICVLLFAVKQLEHATGMAGAKIVNIYNWGDYIDPELIDKFEEETGYKVNYETFDSNEAMFTKIQQGGTAYDITIPSEYMIQKMMKENLLVKLDHSKIKGLENIHDDFLDLSFDPGNQYSIPYFWGTLGIVYNDKFIKDGAIASWNDLWKEDFRDSLMVIDGAREVMGIGLQSLGYSLNYERRGRALRRRLARRVCGEPFARGDRRVRDQVRTARSRHPSRRRRCTTTICSPRIRSTTRTV